jgi:hypothetical protein
MRECELCVVESAPEVPQRCERESVSMNHFIYIAIQLTAVWSVLCLALRLVERILYGPDKEDVPSTFWRDFFPILGVITLVGLFFDWLAYGQRAFAWLK